MTFAQKVAAIKREKRKRTPRNPIYNQLAEITRRVFIPRAIENSMVPSMLELFVKNEMAGGVWRSGVFCPLKPHEVAERREQWETLRQLEGV